MKCTIFKNVRDIKNPNYITVVEALDRIRNGKSEKNISIVRKAKDKKAKADAKKNLPSVCFSGKFSERKDNFLIEHSGYVILDFDDIEDVDKRKKELCEDKYSYAVWISPSGNGLKVLVKIPPREKDHEHYYMGLIDKYPELDTTSRNLSRVCYESYDPEIYINEDSEVWTDKKMEAPKKEVTKDFKTPTKSSNNNHSWKTEKVLEMIISSPEGNKYNELMKASYLAGGYVSGGFLNESEILTLMEQAIMSRNPTDVNQAMRGIADGFAQGKLNPISDTEQTTTSNNGKVKVPVELFSSKSDEKEWIEMAIANNIPQGYDMGSSHFDEHYRLKPETLVGIFGIDNVGKTTFQHFMSVCYAKKHHENFLLICKENQASTVRQKIMELHTGVALHLATKEQVEEARTFAYKYFDILRADVDIEMSNFFEVMEEVYKRKHYFVTFIDPYNAIQHSQLPKDNYKFLDNLRKFQKNWKMSFHVSMHISTERARNWVYGEQDSMFDFQGNEIATKGQMRMPRKNFVEGGQPIANKLDDIIIVHRLVKLQELRSYTLVSIDKVKEELTGGMPTYEDPIMFYKEFGFDTFQDRDKKNPLVPNMSPRVTPPSEGYNANAAIESARDESEFDQQTFELE